MFKKLFITAFAMTIATLSPVFAGECSPCHAKVQSYAHPSLMNAEVGAAVDAKSVHVVGAKMHKSKNKFGVKNKEKVFVATWAKDILSLIKNKSKSEVFNPKMPILRSEIAVVLSEGFNLSYNKKGANFADVVQGYWAYEWITRATQSGVMVGYPTNVFKPDQPITKAEVFAVVAKLIEVPTDRSLLVPEVNGKKLKNIPMWSLAATKEVAASGLLNNLPDADKACDDKYLSKEQVAYLIGSLRSKYAMGKMTCNIPCAKGCPVDKKCADKCCPKDKGCCDKKADCCKKGCPVKKADCCKKGCPVKNGDFDYRPVYLTVKIADKVSAKTSNVGQKFAGKLTQGADVNGKYFPEGSKVVGEVVAVQRPGVKNPGMIKVKFCEIEHKDMVEKFPKSLTEVEAAQIKNPNILARLVAAPFSMTARVVGVGGRTIGNGVNIIANGAEEIADEVSDGVTSTLSLQPVAGVKRFGSAFCTFGKGLYNTCKNIVSGVFGVFYEIGDEVIYVFAPSLSNSSSINPNEEIVIIF